MRRRAARSVTFVVIALASFAIRCTPKFTEVTSGDDAGADASDALSGATFDATPHLDAAVDDAASADAPTTTSEYALAVLASMPSVYYRLGDVGKNAVDLVGADPGVYGARTTQATAGLIAGDPDHSVTFPNPPGSSADPTNIVLAPASAALEPTNGLTIECWVHPVELIGEQSVVSYGDDLNQSWVLKIRNNALDFFSDNMGKDVKSSSLIAVATTTYAAVTFDAAAAIVAFYSNGVLTDQQAYPAGNLRYGSSAGLGIGGSANGDSTFNGVIDEVAVYGRALTAKEIALHYSIGSGN